jgi:thioredoxin-related protein
MNTGPYSNEKVQKFIMENFIPLKSQCFWDKPTELMQKFEIKWTPTLIVHDAEGKEHHRTVGYLPVDDLIAQLTLAKGKIYFNTERFPEAITQFQTVIDQYPDTGAAPEAIFLAGVAGYKRTHDAKFLRQIYDRLTAKYPQSEWARRAEAYSAIPL